MYRTLTARLAVRAIQLQRRGVSMLHRHDILKSDVAQRPLFANRRVAYRSDVDEAIDLLSESVINKNGFVADLISVIDATAEVLIFEAEAAIWALGQPKGSSRM